MFSQRLKSARKAQGLTQIELAKRVPTSQSYIAQLEASDRLPSMEMLNTLAETLDVTPAYLLGEALNETDQYANDPRLSIYHDQRVSPGLRDLVADEALYSKLDVKPWELQALRSLDVRTPPNKDGYLLLLMALRSTCSA